MRKSLKYVVVAAAFAVAISSCTVDSGTMPGNDGSPQISMYTFGAKPPYDGDQDMLLRVAGNNKVSEVYYLTEPLASKEAFLASGSKEAYADKVVSEGTKQAFSGDFVDVVINLPGTNAVSAVGVGADGTRTQMAEAQFTGLIYTDVAAGTYHYKVSARSGVTPFTDTPSVTLQRADGDPNTLRFKDLFGPGYSMKIVLLPALTATDDGGTYTFARIPAQVTGRSYTTAAGATYPINVRDVGYWQNNEAFVTEGGYESGVYFDAEGKVTGAFFLPAWYNGETGTGAIGYNYDEFVVE